MKATSLGAYGFCEGKWKWQKTEPPSIHGAYMLHRDASSPAAGPFTNVGALVLDLLTRLGRERAELRSSADYFSAVGFSGTAQGIGRDWPLTLYGSGVQERIAAEFDVDRAVLDPRDLVTFRERDRWSEWSPVFY